MPGNDIKFGIIIRLNPFFIRAWVQTWMELDIGEDLWMRVRWLESEMLRLLPAPPCNRDGME